MGSYVTVSESSSFSYMTGPILDMMMLDGLYTVDPMYNVKYVKVNVDSLMDLLFPSYLRTIPTKIAKELNSTKILIASIPNVKQRGKILSTKSDNFCFARNGSRCSQICVPCDNPEICATDGYCWCEDGFKLFDNFTCLREDDRHFELKETSAEGINSTDECQCQCTTYFFFFEICT